MFAAFIVEGFEVIFFYMSLVDNSSLDEATYSVILSETFPEEEPQRAKIKVAVLPRHYYSGRNTLRFDQLIGDFMESAM